MQVSKNFTLQELTHSEIALRNGWDNSPPPAVYENLIRLANLLEEVRFLLGKPILINSAYRSKIVNDSLGSKESSQHRLGCAADIRVAGMTPEEVARTIKCSDIQFDQMIKEFDSWVHISVTNNPNETARRQTLIIDKQGTRQYI